MNADVKAVSIWSSLSGLVCLVGTQCLPLPHGSPSREHTASSSSSLEASNGEHLKLYHNGNNFQSKECENQTYTTAAPNDRLHQCQSCCMHDLSPQAVAGDS